MVVFKKPNALADVTTHYCLCYKTVDNTVSTAGAVVKGLIGKCVGLFKYYHYLLPPESSSIFASMSSGEGIIPPVLP